MAQVILQSRREGHGLLKLRATAEGLQPAHLEIELQDVVAPPLVPPAEPETPLLSWRVSPATGARPDPNAVLAENDMNSWGWDEPPVRRGPEAGSFRLYRSNVNVRADRNDGRAQLVFGRIAGKAEVWVDGFKLGEKTDAQPAPLPVTLPKDAQRRQVTVLVEATPGQPSGLWGRVVLEKGPP